MVLAVVFIAVAIVGIVWLFISKSKNKDSNGPMNNN